MGVYETLFGFDQDNLEASEVTKKPRQKRMDRTKYQQRLEDEGALYTVE